MWHIWRKRQERYAKENHNLFLPLMFRYKNTKKTETNDSFIKIHLYKLGL